MSFEGGVASFELSHGQSATAEGLPNGVGYAVEEEDCSGEGYETSSQGARGAIAEGEEARASFTNTRDVPDSKKKIPATGDHTESGFWLGMAGLLMTGMAGLVFKKWGKKELEGVRKD